jgi:hypothetical protein
MVATLGRRRDKLERLLRCLLPQVEGAGGAVTVEALWNNGERPIGQVREAMMLHTQAAYINFIDDDDLVSENYVASVLPRLDGIVDYIGWKAQLWKNGNLQPLLVYHTLDCGRWYEDEFGYFRDLTHFNPIRRELAVQSSFLGDCEKWSEDYDWANKLRGKVHTQDYIDEIMYYQYYDVKDSTGMDSVPDTGSYERLVVSSPYFSWHPESLPA